MTYHSRLAMLALAALTPISANATAEAAPVSSAPSADAPDAERMAVARQIVAIAMPPDQADVIVTRMLDALIGPTLANVGNRFDVDPGLKKLWTDYLNEITTTTRDTMRGMIPEMREAYTIAYARHFTREELGHILAFGQTATGAKYLSRSSELLQDKSIKAMMVKTMTETSARIQPSIEAFKVKSRDYLAAHPDVAKAVAQGE